MASKTFTLDGVVSSFATNFGVPSTGSLKVLIDGIDVTSDPGVTISGIENGSTTVTVELSSALNTPGSVLKLIRNDTVDPLAPGDSLLYDVGKIPGGGISPIQLREELIHILQIVGDMTAGVDLSDFDLAIALSNINAILALLFDSPTFVSGVWDESDTLTDTLEGVIARLTVAEADIVDEAAARASADATEAATRASADATEASARAAGDAALAASLASSISNLQDQISSGVGLPSGTASDDDYDSMADPGRENYIVGYDESGAVQVQGFNALLVAALTWHSGRTYAEGDMALRSSTLYISRTGSNTGNDPSTDNTNWKPAATPRHRVGTKWKTSLAAYTDPSTLDVSGQVATADGLAIGDSGSKMYVADANDVYMYTLATPYFFEDASYASATYASTEAADIEGVKLSSDGTKMWLLDGTDLKIYQYTLATPWVISSGVTYDSVYLDVSGECTDPDYFAVSEDGTKVYVGDITANEVYQYTLSSANDMSTGSYDSKSLSVPADTHGIAVSDDGTAMLTMEDKDVTGYTLSTAYDISTAVDDAADFDASSVVSGTAKGLVAADTGDYVYVTGNTTVYRITLSQEFGARQKSHFASFGVADDAASDTGAEPPGPDNSELVTYLGTSAFTAQDASIQVRKSATGVYQVQLPSGLTWGNVIVANIQTAESSAVIAYAEPATATTLTVSTLESTSGGALDLDWWISLELVS